MMMCAIALLLSLAIVSNVLADAPQVATYVANHGNATVFNSNSIVLTSMFSPDSSQSQFTALVQSANQSLWISTPGWSSWSYCTPHGCEAAFLRANEEFPVFQALLNAIHRGVKVRIICNELPAPDTGKITPLDFLKLAGAEVYVFRTLAYLHTKFMMADESQAIISSVNYDYTSFEENREAGVVISGTDAKPLCAFLARMYNIDVAAGLPWPTQTYNATVMAVINDPSHVAVRPVPKKHYDGAYTSHQTTVVGAKRVTVLANPDSAWSTVRAGLLSATRSLDVYIYQVTGAVFCDTLEQLLNDGVSVRMLVSDRIVSKYAYNLAQQCYRKLAAAGATIRVSDSSIYVFEHQKFWIVDDETLFLSSGNAGETDFPSGSSDIYPPPGQSNYRHVNRDHTVVVDSRDFASAYKHVLNMDYKRARDFSG